MQAKRSLEAHEMKKVESALDRAAELTRLFIKNAERIGVPYGNRTRVAAVKGRCPRPLDERDADGEFHASGRKRVTLS